MKTSPLKIFTQGFRLKIKGDDALQFDEESFKNPKAIGLSRLEILIFDTLGLIG